MIYWEPRLGDSKWMGIKIQENLWEDKKFWDKFANVLDISDCRFVCFYHTDKLSIWDIKFSIEKFLDSSCKLF